MLKFIRFAALAALSLSFSHAANAQQFIDVSKGGNQICAITQSNDLVCSTISSSARLEPPANIPKLSDVEVGDSHACGLDLSGQIVCWGDNNFGQLNAPTQAGFVSLDAGLNHTCAVDTNLSSVCWGLPDNGRLEVPTDGLPFIELQAGLVNTCGLEAAGGIRCWGVESFRWDPPGADADITSFGATYTNGVPFLCALLDDGTIECNKSFLSFSGIYTDIVGAGRQICALTTDGRIECVSSSNIEFIDPIALADGDTIARLYGNQGLCVLNESNEIACSDADRTPGSGMQPASNFIPLPGTTLSGPQAIDNLRATIYSETTVELFWSPWQKTGDGRFVAAEIYRNGDLLVTTAQSTSYLDTTLQRDTDYVYDVRIVNSRGDVGPESNAVTVNTGTRTVITEYVYEPPTRLANPTVLDAFDNEDNTIDIFWSQSANNVFGYEIYRDHDYIGFTRELEFLDEGITSYTTYHYDVIAVSEAGEVLGFAGTESYTLD